MSRRRFFFFSARQNPQPKLFHFDHALDGAVDRANGIIRGVSVITSGVTARGHKLEIDDKTVEQLFECAIEKGKVPVKLNHKSGIGEVCGYLNNFHIEGTQLRADWHLLKSHSEYETTLERAEVMPECFGLSAAFTGIEEKLAGGKKAARCDELISVDCVATPAANPTGLLEARLDAAEFDTAEEGNMPAATPTTKPAAEPTLADLMAKLNEISARQDATEAFQQDLLAEIEGEDSEDEAEDADETGDEGDEVDADEAADEGAGTGESAGAGEPSAGGAELSRDLGRALTYLEARVAQRQEEEEDAQLNHALSVIEEKITLLAAENDALREAYEARGGNPVHLSADDEGAETRYFSAESAGSAFEKRVAFHLEAGKSQAQAVSLAIKEDGGRAHRAHLAAQGVIRL